MTNTSKAEQVANIKLEDVMSVYSGRDGKCCCGCAGNHRYASQHVEAASKNRGYAVDADEVNDRQVKKVFNIVQANRETADFEGDFASVVIGARLYVVYLLRN